LATIKTVLDQLDDAKEPSRSNDSSANQALATLQVFEIPEDKLGKGPQAIVAKIVTSFTAELSSQDDNLTATTIMTTGNEKQAEQLQQMASGFVAMIDLAQSMDSNDKDLKQIRETLKGVETKILDKQVTVTLTLNSDQIAKAISKELGININFSGSSGSSERALAEAKLKEEQQKLEKSKREADSKLEEIKQQLEKIK